MQDQHASEIALALAGLQRSIEGLHEDFKTHSAVLLLLEWTKMLDPRHHSARELLDSLEHDQGGKEIIEKIHSGQKVAISRKYEGEIRACFAEEEEHKLTPEGEAMLLDSEQAIEIKWLATFYLNKLEGILSSVKQGLPNDALMRDEFRPLLFFHENGKNAHCLSTFEA